MGRVYILVEREEKRQTLHGVLPSEAEVLVAPPVAAVVEAKNVDHLARGEEGFIFRPAAAAHTALKTLLQDDQADIYLAFDRSDRGEYNSWLWAGMIGQLSKGALQCRRLHLACLDEQGLSTAMALVEPIDSGQAARYYFEECFQHCFASHLQRLLGTTAGPGGLPLSILALTILALLAERDKEARQFSGSPKWQVKLAMQGPDGQFPAQLQEFFGVSCDGTLAGRSQAKEVAEDLVGQAFRIVSRQEQRLQIAAPRPYTIYELVFDAYRYCQIPVGQAMEAAIALSSGQALAGKQQALISSLYPVVLGNMQPLVEAVQQSVEAQFGDQALQSRTLEGHGIMPVNAQLRPEELAGLSPVELKIYDLVWRRAMASQMPGAVGTEIIVELETKKYRLRSEARVIDDPGFLQVCQFGFESLMAAQPAGVLQEGEEATVAQVVPEQRATMAPDLYTLPTLAEDLAELGIGRQQEVVELVGRLCAADYVSGQANGTLQCGPNLFKVVHTLNRAFPAMQGMNFVVYYAQTVDEVASGRKRFQMGLKQFDQNLFLQGKPLVKVKMPTSIPQRLKKSKSIIKSEGPPQARDKVEAPSGEESPLFTDFSRLVGAGPEPVADLSEEEGGETAYPPLAQDAAASAGPEEGLEVEAGDRPELAALQGQAVETAPPPEQATADYDADSIVLDVEAVEEGADEVASEEDAQVFQEADAMPPPAAALAGGGESAAAEPQPFSPPAAEEKGYTEVVTKPCPQCGRPMVAKGDRFGQYWACTGKPACTYSEGVATQEAAEALLCPLCHQGQLVVKRTPAGKDMYVCPQGSCEFMAWSRPHPIHCPLCSSPFLVEKKGVGGTIVLRCPKAGCNYSQAEEGGASKEEPAKKRVVVRRKKGSTATGGKRKVVVRRRKK